MSNRVYPSSIFGLMPSVVKTTDDDTIIQSSANRVELRIAQTQNPIWHFNLIYEQLFNDLTNPNYTVSELQYLMGFRQASQGQFDSFLLTDPEDNAVVDQPMQLIVDNITNPLSPVYYTPIQRNQGGQFFEDITDLNGAITSLKANGVSKVIGGCSFGNDAELHGPGLSFPGGSFMGLYLKWCAPPTPPITASFNFYFRVRFEEPKQDFERFLFNLWTIGGAEGQRGSGTVKLVTARDLQ